MKKGFTLVELLAVIVILAIILAIAVPTISSLVENSKKSMFQNSAKMILKSMKNDYDGKIASTGIFTDTFILYEDGVRTVYPSSNNLDFTISVTDGGIVRHSDGTVTFALYDGTNCAIKKEESNEIEVINMDKSTCISDIIYKQSDAPFNTIVQNGNYDNGTTGWVAGYSVLSSYPNVLQIIGSGTRNRLSLTFTRNAMVASNKYYFNFDFKAKNPDVTNIVYYVGSVYATSSGITNAIQDKLYNFKTIFSCQSNNYALFYIYYPDADIATNKIVEFSNVILIDLTRIYGAGYEPTQEQMAHNLNKVWIDPTTNTPRRFTAGGWIAY